MRKKDLIIYARSFFSSKLYPRGAPRSALSYNWSLYIVVMWIWVKVRKYMRQLPLRHGDYADTAVTHF